MLPKVANQLIHHTSRAVAAVQNQTGHTIRNVLHLQSSSPTPVGNRSGPGSSSSGRGSNGAGAGGARTSGSSRFHSSYSALSRSVTQADPSVLHSATVEAADEGDEVVNATPSAVASRRLRQRARRGSFALSVYDRDSLQKSGLLYALQQHARATHAFAAPPSSARVAEASPKDAEQAPSAYTEDAGASARGDTEEQLIASLRNAKLSNDHAQVLALVEDVRRCETPCSSSVYNAALDALYRTRPGGEAPVALLELYNDMVARSVLPNGTTYTILISALSDRDLEVVAQTSRIKEQARQLVHIKRYKDTLRRQDEARLNKLRSENNLPSALILFQAGCLLRNNSFSRNVYTVLLRSCAAAGNVDAALRVFSHLEKRLTPGIPAYRYLLEAHSKSGDLAGAKEVFSAYLEVSKAGQVFLDSQSDERVWRINHVAVFNEMIRSYIYHGQASEALGVLEQMLGAEASADFQLAEVPSPSPSTFTGIINGFIRTGDLDSAFTWFNRLLQEPTLPQEPLVPVPRPTKPTAAAWKAIINALAYSERASDLKQVIDAASPDNGYTIDNSDRFAYVYSALRQMDLPGNLDHATLDQLFETHIKALYPYEVDHATGLPQDVSFDVIGVYMTLMKLYMSLGDPERAVGCLEYFVPLVADDSLAGEQAGQIGSDVLMHRKKALRILLASGGAHYWYGPDRPLSHTLRLAALCFELDMIPRDPVAGYYIKYYTQASAEEKKLLTQAHWELLIQGAVNVLRKQPLEGEDYFKKHATVSLTPARVPAEFDIMSLVADVHQHGIDLRTMQRTTQLLLAHTLVNDHGPEEASKRLQQLDPGYDEIIAPVVPIGDSRVHPSGKEVDGLSASAPDTTPTTKIRQDAQVSRFVDEWYAREGSKEVTAQHGFQRFKAGTEMGVYPRTEVIGRLIAAMGRAGELEKLHELYQGAQLVLTSLADEKQAQSLGWFLIEDQMIIGLAHAGEVEAAHVHRMRILEQSGSPSADAYGALIENVTDTTDDTTNALTLFEECRARGVTPNIYLYNTVISKLAKARKADHAIQLFHQMQAEHVRPTSVTYGALIAACCRVGDAISAETLFTEMTAQKNFKPRIPPYNTMMQLYTHTKPDRERVLHYFNEMRRVGVKPTAHTYKLLMDAYGTIEPIDTAAMQQAFDTLVADPQVAVQGTHWAALINAWGCAKKDLNQAIAIFESIPSHPSTKPNSRQPDAVVFEALINVFVTLRCPELIAQYRARIPELGIRMTAYIANLLIKGYAAAGDVVEARNIFEALADPPEGIAAPFNHAPHGDQPAAPLNHLNLPDGTVYREPSTWEAMVRAELGHGNRDEALALLERVRARRFPPAVYHRISGIMLDDSVSPWGRGSEASAPSTP